MGYFRVRREPTRPLHLSLGLPLVVTCDRASPTAARQPESSVNLAPFVVHTSSSGGAAMSKAVSIVRNADRATTRVKVFLYIPATVLTLFLVQGLVF